MRVQMSHGGRIVRWFVFAPQQRRYTFRQVAALVAFKMLEGVAVGFFMGYLVGYAVGCWQ